MSQVRIARPLGWLLGGLGLAIGMLAGIHLGRAVPSLDPHEPALVEAAREFGLDADLLRGLVAAESGGDPTARSKAGAIGLCQLMLVTAREQATRLKLPSPDAADLEQPGLNLRLGASYLARMLRMFESDLVFALAAYNAGPGRVRSWQRDAPDVDARAVLARHGFEETRLYVDRVLHFRDAYRRR